MGTEVQPVTPSDEVPPPNGEATSGADGAGDATGPEVPAPAPRAPGVDGLTDDDRRRLRRTWAGVAAPLLLANWWILTGGRWTPWQTRRFGDFFDVQARSFMEGRWDVPSDVVRFEGFLVEGQTYIYFGPLPALLRIPLFMVTDRFDGRLIMLSMFAALVVLTIAAYRLMVALRAFVRGPAPVGRRELVATGVLAVAVLTGAPYWMSSLAMVHHEASLWGVAMTVAALDAIVRWMIEPTAKRLTIAGVLIAAAGLSRFTLGMGALAALGAISFFVLVGRLRARRQTRPAEPFLPTPIWALATVGVVVLVVACLPNTIRFGHPTDVPMDRHIYSFTDAHRQEFLEISGGQYFGLHYAPTTLRQYLRPDALNLRRDMPWIDFPETKPEPVGDVFFDALEWSSSVPSAMPALTVLAGVGMVWSAVAVRRRRPEMWLVPMWMGTLVGASAVITIAYVGHRYLTDLYPVVLIPALVGFHKLLSWTPAPRASLQRRARPIAAAGLVVLTGFGALTALALSLQYQRERGFTIAEQTRAEWVRLRAGLPGAREPLPVALGDDLPAAGWESQVAVVGDCDGVYLFTDDTWEPVERGPGVAVHDLRLNGDDLRSLGVGDRVPLLTLSNDEDFARATVVALTRGPEDLVRVDVWTGPDDGWALGNADAIDDAVDIRVIADRFQSPGTVWLDDELLYNGRMLRGDHETRVVPGRVPEGLDIPGLRRDYPGRVEPTPSDMPACRALTG